MYDICAHNDTNCGLRNVCVYALYTITNHSTQLDFQSTRFTLNSNSTQAPLTQSNSITSKPNTEAAATLITVTICTRIDYCNAIYADLTLFYDRPNQL